jgi:hypothetical protein
VHEVDFLPAGDGGRSGDAIALRFFGEGGRPAFAAMSLLMAASAVAATEPITTLTRVDVMH